MAGPPRPPLETRPSTFISKSSVSGSIRGRDGNVFEETTASPPAANTAPASITMSVVEGVSLAQTGTLATSFTTCVTVEQSLRSLPMFEPMSSRSMCGQERLSSRPSAPCSWQALARVCQFPNSLSEPEPAMMEATSARRGKAFLIRPRRGTHQSSGLSEMSSQFHDECSTPSRPLFMESGPPGCARRNLVLGPSTFTTGCRPMVLVTTPPQPASNARRMLLSDSVGGADESRKGFSKRMPVNVVDRSGAMRPPILFRAPRTGARAQAAVATACPLRPPATAAVMEPTSMPAISVNPIQTVICGRRPIATQVATGPRPGGKFGGSTS